MASILVTGSNGLVGTALCDALAAQQHEVYRLVRTNPRGDHELCWNPPIGVNVPNQLNGIEIVVHLAGRSIASFRWTKRIRTEIRNSRILGTRCLCSALLGLKRPPQLFICASAVGYYGTIDRSEPSTESSTHGAGFLAETCVKWENESRCLEKRSVRVVNLRLGMILDKHGGALSKMLPIFRAGLGGRLGDGEQKMSWVDLADVIRVIQFLIEHDSVDGPVNVVSPHVVTNREFTNTLGAVIHRPTCLPVPKFAIRLILGQMGTEMLLASTFVTPKKLTDHGYQFMFPKLKDSLQCHLRPDEKK